MKMHRHLSFLALVFALLGVLSSLKFGCESIVGDYRNRSCIESEKRSLVLLKESLVDDFNYLSSWIGDDCCAWHGIGCNNATGHVIQLDLRNGLLKGDMLYPTLLDLKYLTYLDLSNNSFGKMKIPQFFGSFKDLTYLNLSYSSFEGLVPHHLGNLSKLRYLDLSNNYYDNFNYFLSIDSMRWLAGLSMLKHLDLSDVDLSRATNWFSSINMLSNSISVLRLSSCSLSNNIPRHLPLINLTSLVSLDLGYNRLNSSFPSWVLNNTGLAHLYLGFNQFNGSIPDSIGTLTSLLELDLSENNFSGSLPESIGRLKSLSSLDVSLNKFQGSLPESMRRLTGLTELYLRSNEFKGLIPKWIGNLTALSQLQLSENKFTGLIPESVGHVTSLTSLDLSNNNFQGLIPHSIGNLTSLYFLNFFHNELRGGLPEEVCQLSKLESLSVDTNQLSENIPECIGELSSSNSDDDKEKLGLDFGEMIIDDMKGYELKYTSTLEFLYSIDLSNNNIDREIPEELMDLRGLLNLNLAGNRLTGRIPKRIGKLKKLEVLDLSRNKLYGSIPQSLSDLNFISRLNLSLNNLSGRIPTGNQLQTLEDPSIYAGNNQLCGQPILKPCTDYPDSHNAHIYNEADSNSDDERMWFYAGIGPGLLCGFLGFCAFLHFIKSWRYSFFHFTELVFDKTALAIALLRKRFQN